MNESAKKIKFYMIQNLPVKFNTKFFVFVSNRLLFDDFAKTKSLINADFHILSVNHILYHTIRYCLDLQKPFQQRKQIV